MIDNKCYLLNNKKNTGRQRLLICFIVLARVQSCYAFLRRTAFCERIVYFLLVQCKNIHKKYLEFYEQTLTKQGNLNSLQQFIT